MWIKVRIANGVVIGKLTSKNIIDQEMNQQIGSELMDLLDAADKTKKLLVSFQGVQFMSSAMIGNLVSLSVKARDRGIQLKFCDLSRNVLEVFKITGLRKQFDIVKPEDLGLLEFDDYNPDDYNPDDDGPGSAGVFAKLPKHPSSGGTHAQPPREDS